MANWRLESNCLDQPLDMFFPTGRSKDAAVKLCNGCPVREQCLDFALDNVVDYGIWGGLTPKERRAVLRFRGELNGDVLKNPRTSFKSKKRSNFKMT